MLAPVVLALTVSIFTACQSSDAVANKTGAQLWGENCNRCHSAPSQDQYSKDQWGIIVTHMKMKAGITNDEATKIATFLKGG